MPVGRRPAWAWLVGRDDETAATLAVLGSGPTTRQELAALVDPVAGLAALHTPRRRPRNRTPPRQRHDHTMDHLGHAGCLLRRWNRRPLQRAGVAAPALPGGLSGPARRAWRLSNLAVLGLTLALTLNFWVEAQRTGRYWNWQPYVSWALITWLAMSGYRRSRFQLHWRRWQIAVLGVAGLAFLGIGVWTLVVAILEQT
ncbi:MAG: hypothetical protein HZY76_05765 [Anaerolineae bacterium]|nr:MAG: hypothetical protein HZY76_05765 [Anaerolineae bacterium]